MGLTRERIEEIRKVLRQIDVDAWVLYNFRDLNPVACRLLGLDEGVHQTRRWVSVIPAEGEPEGLIHAIEPHLEKYLPGRVTDYSSLDDFTRELSRMLGNVRRVAMEYSPGNGLPVVSRVDGGTLELVRGCGVDVVSSGELISRIESRLDAEQISHAIAAGASCRRVMQSAFTLIADSVATGSTVKEYDVVAHILEQLKCEGLVTDHEPNCSVGANSANPHYQPTPHKSDPIREGDFVLIDLWGRAPGRSGIYGDITWTGFVGAEVPEKISDAFSIVRDARDAALQAVRDAFEGGTATTGAEIDRVARRIIEEGGYGEEFIHRTGHSITHELHGAGTNLDSLETIDDRPLIRSSSFSIEPGIYLTGEFGVRTEIDVVVDGEGIVHVTSHPAQSQVLALLDPEVMRDEGMG